MISAAFSPIIMTEAIVFPETTKGITEASVTLNLSKPFTLQEIKHGKNVKKLRFYSNGQSSGKVGLLNWTTTTMPKRRLTYFVNNATEQKKVTLVLNQQQ